jgi:Holliday junction resolvase
MPNSRQKGAVGEELVRKLLRTDTGLGFERVPGSGSGKIKGDLYIPEVKNAFCIEIKNYADSPLNDKIFTSKTNNLNLWWTKLCQQSKLVGQKPLLFFKYNRSKVFVVTDIKPENTKRFLYISWLNCYSLLYEEWIINERIKWQN